MGDKFTAFSYTYSTSSYLTSYLPPISSRHLSLFFCWMSYLAWQKTLSLNKDLSERHFTLLCLLTSGHRSLIFFSQSLSSCLVSSHILINRDWRTPKPTRHASSAPTYPATSSRTVWSTSCLLSPPVSACSPFVALRALTILTPAALTATGQ